MSSRISLVSFVFGRGIVIVYSMSGGGKRVGLLDGKIDGFIGMEVLHISMNRKNAKCLAVALLGGFLSLSGMYMLSLGESFAESVVATAPISIMEFIYIHVGLMALGGALVVASAHMYEQAAYQERAEQMEERYFEDSV